MNIRDIMTTGLTTATPDTSLEEIATMMKNENVGTIPIVEDDELCGLITDRDIVVRCVAEGRNPADIRAEDILSEDLHVIEVDEDADAAAELMARHQVRRLPVVENGRLVGIVSIGDFAVKEGDDTKSGDTLQGISKGVKRSSGEKGKSGGNSRSSGATAKNIRAPQKRGVSGENEGRAGRMRQQGLRDKQDSGSTGRSSVKNAATRGRSIKPGEQGITNRSAGEETKRNERVIPFRDEARSSSRKPATRKKAG
jgi:CBS domain-containing protein